MKYPKYFVTGNKDKLREVNEILQTPLEQIDVDLDEIQAIDVEVVAKQKAIEAYRRVGKSVLVEDTGLSFAALNNFPGALIKWFLDSLSVDGIFEVLKNYENREVFAETTFAFFDGEKVHVFSSKLEGSVPLASRGNEGFGWDALFVPKGHTKSFAEMNSKEKNEISTRRLALEKLASICAD